ncbi:ANTAR domain-containing response regulator [Melghirimyces profundicolus]|uniref:ANTAR domain-containing response regulator n=1 Tax=Melghirimyces profundicolus TaxID=1242148 RepID=UPI001FE30262|nr:response regulator [Melghirimyces profundicolus]
MIRTGKAKILLAEDNTILRMDLHEILIQAGYEVVAEAGNGNEAIELSASHRPNLVLMDIKMPKMNGLKASRIIGNAYNIPSLILTAYSQKEFVQEAENAFIVGYLVKPIRETDLVPAVEVALQQAKRLYSLQSQNRELNQKLEDRKIIERAKGLLMKEKGWAEEAAFKKMRSYCMMHNLSMVNLARSILEKERTDYPPDHDQKRK